MPAKWKYAAVLSLKFPNLICKDHQVEMGHLPMEGRKNQWQSQAALFMYPTIQLQSEIGKQTSLLYNSGSVSANRDLEINLISNSYW